MRGSGYYIWEWTSKQVSEFFVYSIFFSRKCHLISERQSSFQYKELLNFPDSLVKIKKQLEWQT